MEKAKVALSCLVGDLDGENTPEEPERVVPAEREAELNGSLECELPGYSFTVLRFSSS